MNIESFLTPRNDDGPCGPELEFEVDGLQRTAQGTPEREYGGKVLPPEPPYWPEVQRQAEELLQRSMDLRAACILYEALLNEQGLPGAADGLALVQRMLEEHWADVHPRLDEDDQDPTLRMNSLLVLSDPMRSLRYLRAATLVSVRGIGEFNLRDWLLATGKLKLAAGAEDVVPALAEIEAAFLECPAEVLEATSAAATRAWESAKAIAAYLDGQAGAQAPDLRPLIADLYEIHGCLAAQLARRGLAEGAVPDGAEPAQDSPTGARSSRGEGIRERADVIRAIDLICEYYSKHEPASPVPLLLRRAKRLVDKSFLEIVRDLAPSGMSEATAIAGVEGSEED